MRFIIYKILPLYDSDLFKLNLLVLITPPYNFTCLKIIYFEKVLVTNVSVLL